MIANYLRHQAEIQAYLTERQQQAAQVREQNERRFDPSGVRDRPMPAAASFSLT